MNWRELLCHFKQNVYIERCGNDERGRQDTPTGPVVGSERETGSWTDGAVMAVADLDLESEN